jgi:hypothetical protein
MVKSNYDEKRVVSKARSSVPEDHLSQFTVPQYQPTFQFSAFQTVEQDE